MIRFNEFPRLFLVRHGVTDWSELGKHTGRSDIPLNAQGVKLSQHLALRLSGLDFAKIFTSPLIRASRTCEIAGFKERAEVHTDLVEWDYGDYEGQATDDIHRDRAGWNLFRHGVPNGESPEQVAARADRFLEGVREIDGDVLAFSSGHIIRMIAARWLKLPNMSANYFYTSTASLGVLGYEHNRNEPVVLLWNEVEE
jgi:broad specificity phosphatase PhoE